MALGKGALRVCVWKPSGQTSRRSTTAGCASVRAPRSRRPLVPARPCGRPVSHTQKQGDNLGRLQLYRCPMRSRALLPKDFESRTRAPITYQAPAGEVGALGLVRSQRASCNRATPLRSRALRTLASAGALEGFAMQLAWQSAWRASIRDTDSRDVKGRVSIRLRKLTAATSTRRCRRDAYTTVIRP
jgi:hypothetical protein